MIEIVDLRAVYEIKIMNDNRLFQVVMLGAGLNVMGGISSVEKLILEQGVPEVNLEHIPTLEEGSILKKILVFIKAISHLLSRLLKHKVDIVYIHFSSKGSTFRTAILIVISLFFRKPIVLHSHGSGFHIFYGNLPLWIQKTISYLFSKSSRLVVLSQSWKKFYVSNLHLEETKIVVLPNPVKFPLQIKDTKDSNIVKFLFLGRIGKRKGAFELIEAFSKIPTKQRRQASLTMAGDGDVEQARSLVENLALTEKTIILDWVNSEKRDALLAESDVFVLPSYNEGLPMAIIEAMGFGLSVISSPVGGIPELICHGKNGLLVEPGNIKELSLAMQFLIENKQERIFFAERAKKDVAPLDIKKYCLSLMTLYQDLVKKVV